MGGGMNRWHGELQCAAIMAGEKSDAGMLRAEERSAEELGESTVQCDMWLKMWENA